MIKIQSTDRSIKEHSRKYLGSMTDEVKEWWKGLGEELQIDIEAVNEIS